jgi:Rhodopirellula transposase DDE domain
VKAQFLERGLPVISIETKKKELIGNYRREGKLWRRKPKEVDTPSWIGTPTERAEKSPNDS